MFLCGFCGIGAGRFLIQKASQRLSQRNKKCFIALQCQSHASQDPERIKDFFVQFQSKQRLRDWFSKVLSEKGGEREDEKED